MSTLQEKISEARAKRESVKDLLSESDRLELDERAELARLTAETEEEIEKARGLKIDRGLEQVGEKLGPKVKILSVIIKGFEDWFIVRGDAKAHSRWTNGIQNAAQADQQVDRNALARNYALAVVEMWNGNERTDDPEMTRELSRFLTENPGAVTAITTAAAECVGLMTVSRKS